MDRFWFLTWTTYGTWLPGDDRGFVSNVAAHDDGPEVRHNDPGTPYDLRMRGLVLASRAALKCDPIWLSHEHAEHLVPQLRETASYRGWTPFAIGVMSNHVHIVVGVNGDPEPSDILGDFKSYGSRRLNKRWKKPASGTWWTESGSKRKVKDSKGLFSVIEYVRDQAFPLAIWLNEPAIRVSFEAERAAKLLKASGGCEPPDSVGVAQNQGVHTPRSPGMTT